MNLKLEKARITKRSIPTLILLLVLALLALPGNITADSPHSQRESAQTQAFPAGKTKACV